MARKKTNGNQGAANPVELAPVVRQVKHVLTREERLEVGESLGRLHQELTRATLARAAAAAEWKDEEQRIKQTMARLAEELANGYRWEHTECDLRPDYVGGVMEYVRQDTGEVVGSRALYPIERQATIPQ